MDVKEKTKIQKEIVETLPPNPHGRLHLAPRLGKTRLVLDIIKREGKVSINDIATEIGISDRNVSSQLAYLRKDGWNFGKDSKKRIYIEEE